jgi:hypothetical protein
MFKKDHQNFDQLEQNVPYQKDITKEQDSDQEVNLLRGNVKKVNLNQVD